MVVDAVAVAATQFLVGDTEGPPGFIDVVTYVQLEWHQILTIAGAASRLSIFLRPPLLHLLLVVALVLLLLFLFRHSAFCYHVYDPYSLFSLSRHFLSRQVLSLALPPPPDCLPALGWGQHPVFSSPQRATTDSSSSSTSNNNAGPAPAPDLIGIHSGPHPGAAATTATAVFAGDGVSAASAGVAGAVGSAAAENAAADDVPVCGEDAGYLPTSGPLLVFPRPRPTAALRDGGGQHAKDTRYGRMASGGASGLSPDGCRGDGSGGGGNHGGRSVVPAIPLMAATSAKSTSGRGVIRATRGGRSLLLDTHPIDAPPSPPFPPPHRPSLPLPLAQPLPPPQPVQQPPPSVARQPQHHRHDSCSSKGGSGGAHVTSAAAATAAPSRLLRQSRRAIGREHGGACSSSAREPSREEGGNGALPPLPPAHPAGTGEVGFRVAFPAATTMVSSTNTSGPATDRGSSLATTTTTASRSNGAFTLPRSIEGRNVRSAPESGSGQARSPSARAVRCSIPPRPKSISRSSQGLTETTTPTSLAVMAEEVVATRSPATLGGMCKRGLLSRATRTFSCLSVVAVRFVKAATWCNNCGLVSHACCRRRRCCRWFWRGAIFFIVTETRRFKRVGDMPNMRIWK